MVKGAQAPLPQYDQAAVPAERRQAVEAAQAVLAVAGAVVWAVP